MMNLKGELINLISIPEKKNWLKIERTRDGVEILENKIVQSWKSRVNNRTVRIVLADHII